MIARVFPRRTRATPSDPLAFVGDVPLFLPVDITEVHVSVTFSWDVEEGQRLVRAWERVAPTRIGGPAMGTRGEDFEPGRYLAPGYVITPRGCPNRCWFCGAWKRDGTTRTLPIRDGWNVLDDNLLACPDEHISDVFAMLARQPKRPQFTGGLEPKRLTRSIAAGLRSLKPESVFLAYDTPDDWQYIQRAATNLQEAGHSFRGHRVRCYALIGFPGDSMEAASKRLHAVLSLGIVPAAMLYRSSDGKEQPREWKALQRLWMRPAIINKATTLHGETGS